MKIKHVSRKATEKTGVAITGFHCFKADVIRKNRRVQRAIFKSKKNMLLVQIFNQEIQELPIHFISNIRTPSLGCLVLSVIAVTV